jgi:cysteine desulfurase
MNAEVIYLDYQSTTPVDPRVLAIMRPYWTECFANPSSGHRFGQQAAAHLRDARQVVRSFVGARTGAEIIFTSGATEANHLAIHGVVKAGSPGRQHVITTAVEHGSVLGVCDQLVAAGHAVTKVGVNRHGLVDPAEVAAAITPRTTLISIMHANNEIGAIQPIGAVSAVARKHGIPLHVDAAQSAGALILDVEALGVDLLTVSGHKIYGPKGIGALYVRRGVPVAPQFAGTQEHGLRAGTVNVTGAIGLAAAMGILMTDREHETRRIAELRDDFSALLRNALPSSFVNGAPEHCLPGNLSITIPGVEALDIIDALPDVAISNGSACSGGHGQPSHVLTAIGLSSVQARATLRLSVGRYTRPTDIERAATKIGAVVARFTTHVSPA